jgi:hypothetical protein
MSHCTACGHRIRRTSRRDPRPLAERFWARVDRTGECWLWADGKTRGALNMRIEDVHALGLGNCKIQPAHRVAWVLEMGSPPERLWRTCASVACVRPSHYATAMPESVRRASAVRLVKRWPKR